MRSHGLLELEASGCPKPDGFHTSSLQVCQAKQRSPDLAVAGRVLGSFGSSSRFFHPGKQDTTIWTSVSLLNPLQGASPQQIPPRSRGVTWGSTVSVEEADLPPPFPTAPVQRQEFIKTPATPSPRREPFAQLHRSRRPFGITTRIP